MHLLQIPTWSRGCDSMMWYHVTTELRLRECYQAMPSEGILEEGWLQTDVDRKKRSTG